MIGLNLAGSGIKVHEIYSSGRAKCACPNPIHSEYNDNAVLNLTPELAQRSGYVFKCYSGKCNLRCKTFRDLRKLFAKYGIEIDISNFSEVTPTIQENNSLKKMLEFISLPLALDNEYLKSRGVSNDQVKKFDILGDENRIVFQRHYYDKTFAGITVRFCQPNVKMRYLDYGNKNVPFGISQIDINKRIFITEGAFGVLNLDSFGEQAIGVLGNSNYKFEEIALFFEEIYIAVDKDTAGYEHAKKIKKLIPEAKIMPPFEYDEISKDNFYKLLEKANMFIDAFDFS